MDETYQERCFFCDKPGAIVCDSSECQKHDKDVRDDMELARLQTLRSAVKAVLKQRGKESNSCNVPPHRFVRWFYVCKFLICVAIGWSGCGNAWSDEVELAHFDYHKLYAGWECEYARVGHGVFTNWWYHILHDGDWNM